MWYPSLTDRSSFEDVSHERPAKRRKVMDSEAIAAGEGKESAIKSALKDSSCEKKRRKRQSSCSFNRLEVVDDSVKLKGTKLTFDTFDGDGNRRTHEVNLDADKVSLSEYTTMSMLLI